MQAPIWIIVFDRDGTYWSTVRCDHALEAEHTIYHNIYYGRRCLKISVKNWSNDNART